MSKYPLSFINGNQFRASFNYAARYSAEFGLCYMNNPKVACSTIKASLWFSHRNGKKGFKGDPGAISGSPFVNRYIDIMEINKNNGILFFSCVRNPYSRLKSAWADKIVNGKDMVTKNQILSQIEIDENQARSFETFCYSLRNKNPMELDPHIRPQHLNLLTDFIDYEFLGTFENIDMFFKKLKNEYNVHLTTWRPHRTNNLQHIDYKLSDDAINVIKNVYSEDFKLFGYDLNPSNYSPHNTFCKSLKES